MIRYKQLKTAMFSNDVTWEDLAKEIGKSKSYVSHRSTGKMPFDMNEVYKICDFINIPYEEIPRFFPPNGLE